MSLKGRKRPRKTSIEDIYCNNNFVPPKEQNLETIFEEPRQSKDGAPILTSVRKYKRYLHFDDTQNKIQKRKRNAKKCVKKFKSTYRTTRSTPKDSECDISLYILDVMGDSSSDSDSEISSASNKSYVDTPVVKAGRRRTTRTSSDIPLEECCSDLFESSKNKRFKPSTHRRPMGHAEVKSAQTQLFGFSDSAGVTSANCVTDNYNYSNDTSDSTSENNITDNVPVSTMQVDDTQELTKEEAKIESPRRSCIIS